MTLTSLATEPFEIVLKNGTKRSGVILHLKDENGQTARGEVSPLPQWNKETLQEVLKQLDRKKDAILNTDWSKSTFFYHLQMLDLFPSLLFGLEAALLALYFPIHRTPVNTSALLMGDSKDILSQAKERKQEGYTHAKLKVGNLSFQDAEEIIHTLKDTFRLRIDVNRAWKTQDALKFFAQFPQDSFDYIEEPFSNPADLKKFNHPLALDESYKELVSFDSLAELPQLKALIYKPTVQGGLLNCLPILNWAKQYQIDLVLSSSFESPLGLEHIQNIAQRLSITSPLGIGTLHHLE